MKKLSALFLLCLTADLWPLTSGAQAPQLINYQGRLLNGTNLVNGNVGLSLRLFDAAAAGTLLYEDSNTVTVADGLYSTFIGDNPTNSSFLSALTNPAVWIEVAVDGVALSPRERLASVGYSLATRGISVNANNNIFVFNPAQNSVDSNSTTHATIAGGESNKMERYADHSFIGGGKNNLIATNVWQSFLGGGIGNSIQRDSGHSFLGGGSGNSIQANASRSFLGGGEGNIVSGHYGTVPGGYQNSAGFLSFAAGRLAKATNSGSFVWADWTAVDFGTTADNQFLIRASGGVGIGKTNPTGALDVAGTVTASNFVGSGSGLSGISGDAITDGSLLAADLAASVTTNFVQRTGDSMSGALSISGALVVTNTNGSFTYDGFPPFIGTVLLGRYIGATNYAPQIRFIRAAGGTYMDIGQNTNGDFVVEGNDAPRLVVQNGGNVGIGTSSPKSPLHVAGDFYAKGHVFLHAYEGDGLNGTAYLQARDTSGTSSIALRLRVQNAGSLIEAVQIASNGNVGVGTLTPTNKLQVVGTVHATAFIGNGIGLTNTPSPKGYQEFTTPGSNTWVCPAGVTRIAVEMWGGGGGGGGGATQPNNALVASVSLPGGGTTNLICGGSGGGSGGAGAYIRATLAVTPGSTYGIYVGAGGSAGAVDGTGGNGGSSQIKLAAATLITAAGGSSGSPGSAQTTNSVVVGGAAGAGGVAGATSLTLNRAGGTGTVGSSANSGAIAGGAVYLGDSNQSTPVAGGDPFTNELSPAASVGGTGGRGQRDTNSGGSDQAATAGGAGAAGYVVISLF